MASKLTDLRFDQAANLVDDPANPHAKIVLFKRAVKKDQPSVGSVHVNTPDWKTKDAAYFKAAAEQSAAQQNDLPDSSFAAIEPGGKKDESGKTTPRSLRHLPFKDDSGKVDLPHLRNALSRLSQTQLSDDLKSKARATLESAARSAGVGKSVVWDADYVLAKRHPAFLAADTACLQSNRRSFA